MKKINNKLKCLGSIFILILVFIYILIYSLFFKFCSKNSNNKNISFYPYKYFLNISDVDNNFSNREKLLIKENNTILIGRNYKELINGYYDIKFNIKEDNACIIINNLQKEDINFKSISDEYLNELELFLTNMLNEKNIKELINIIKEEYTSLRNNVDCSDDKFNFRQININRYYINFNIQNNMLKIDIKI